MLFVTDNIQLNKLIYESSNKTVNNKVIEIPSV